MGTAAKPGRRREMNRGPDSYDPNYEMLRRELKDSEKATLCKLRTAKDIDEATKFFMVSFEDPVSRTTRAPRKVVQNGARRL
jgi:hypothetical protein